MYSVYLYIRLIEISNKVFILKKQPTVYTNNKSIDIFIL